MKMIFHSDANNFFASVECILDPSKSGSPLAVAGSVEKRNGIILAKNNLAKKFGVKTGDAIWQAKQKCPELITVLPNFSAYRHFSKLLISKYENYTNKIESFGMDECWLDLTSSFHLFIKKEDAAKSFWEKAEIIAKQLQDKIFEETGIEVSIGVSFTKTFAKIGSDIKKPRGITVITPENFKDIVYPLNVSDIIGVGSKTKAKFEKLNILTIGNFAEFDSRILKSRFDKTVIELQNKILGFDNDTVCAIEDTPPPKSVGNGTTLLRDIKKKDEIEATIRFLCGKVAYRLREKKLAAKCISLSLKSDTFEHFGHDKALPFATNNEAELCEHFSILLDSFWQFNKNVRAVRIATTRLVDVSKEVQLSFYQKNLSCQLDEGLDKIKNKYGYHHILSGVANFSDFLNQDFTIEDI